MASRWIWLIFSTRADLAHSLLGLRMLEDVGVWVRLRTLSVDDDDVARVAAAIGDPDPRTDGDGFARLRAA